MPMKEQTVFKKARYWLTGIGISGLVLFILTGFGYQSGEGELKQLGQIPGYCQYVVLEGNYAYQADGAGLSIVDISDPENPVKKGSLNLSERPVSLEISGNYAYIANGRTGMKVIDISNPEAPVEKATLDTPGFLNQVKIRGSYAYLADDVQGLEVANISDPLNPSILTTCNTPGQARRIAFRDNYLVLSDYRGGMRLFDITTASSPLEVSSLVTTRALLNTAISGRWAYLAWDNDELWVVDLENPLSPIVTNTTITPNIVDDLQVVGNRLYTVGGEGEFRQFDISTPADPQELSCLEIGGKMACLSMNGTLAGIANLDHGLQLVSLENPALPAIKGFYNMARYIWDVKSNEDYAFVSDLFHHFRIFDIRNPDKPVQVSALKLESIPLKMAYQGQYVYLCNNESGLRIIDVSRPENPWIVGNYIPSAETCRASQFYDVALYGNKALISDMNYGLRILDVSNPAQPQELGHYADNSSKGFRGIAVKDSYALVADYPNGLKIFDISTASQPVLVGKWGARTTVQYYGSNNMAMDVAVKGNFAYLASRNLGISVLNIIDPTQPQLVSIYTSYSRLTAISIEIDGNYAYVGMGDNGLMILDITNPANLKEVATAPTSGFLRNGFINAYKNFLTAEGLGGMRIFQYQPTDFVATPSNLVCYSPSSTENQLYWKDNADNESHFILESHNGDGNFQGIAQIPANSTSFRITGLTTGLPYYYRLYARNSSYLSGYSNTAASVPGAPKAPTELYALSLDSGSYHLYWTDNSNNETGFELEVQLDRGEWKSLMVLPANKTDYTFYNLAKCHTYAFRVKSVNTLGTSEPSNEVLLYVAEGITGVPEAHWRYLNNPE